jgi:hydrogenase maturation protein HypF
MQLPGGDKAAEEPWRMAVSMLYKTFGWEFLKIELPMITALALDKLERITEAVERNINCPLSSGAGRLFDAIAAISGICIQSLHHAEAPMRLEAAIAGNIEDGYSVLPGREISFVTMVEEICRDMKAGINPGTISAKFHNTVVHAALETVKIAALDKGLNRVVLSGGTFQNKYLAERLEYGLRKAGFEVFTHTQVPCNDGGLALGQLAVAAHRILK